MDCSKQSDQEDPPIRQFFLALDADFQTRNKCEFMN